MKWYDNPKIMGTALIIAIAIATFICSLFTPWAGDDLAYGMGYAHYHEGSILYYPQWVCRHWVYNNGRAANFLATLIMHFAPIWITCLLNALVTALFYWIMVKWCTIASKATSFITVFLITFILFCFCWWDSFFLIDVSLNYVWATAFGLTWLWIFMNKRKYSPLLNLLIIIFSVIAGCMHEAMSTPLFIGVMAWVILTRPTLSQNQKWYLLAFAVGTAIVFFSLGSWHRFGREKVADDPLWLLLLKSDWLVLLMLLVYSASFAWKSQRDRFKHLMQTSDIIWPIAAMCSLCFSAVGGIVGRSGWFASAFALIALSQWSLPYFRMGKLVSNVLCTLLIAAMAFHLTEWVRWQIRTGKEMETILKNYQYRPSSPVFHDYTTIDQVPTYLLNRLRLVPDADNYYELYTIRTQLGDSIHQPIFLPRDLANIKPWQIPVEGLRIGNGIVKLRLSESEIIPAPSWSCDTVAGRQPILPGAFIIKNGKGEQLTATPYYKSDTLLYYITPRLINPGDR